MNLVAVSVAVTATKHCKAFGLVSIPGCGPRLQRLQRQARSRASGAKIGADKIPGCNEGIATGCSRLQSPVAVTATKHRKPFGHLRPEHCNHNLQPDRLVAVVAVCLTDTLQLQPD
jgi:hypothetical protein